MTIPDQSHNQPRQDENRFTRVQAFRVALTYEAVRRGVNRYTAKEFVVEFAGGVGIGHLYHTLQYGRNSRKLVRAVDTFIGRHLPDWTPSAEEAAPRTPYHMPESKTA